MKRVVKHMKNCKRKTNGGYPICKQLIALCHNHAKRCQKTKCLVRFCFNIKHKKKQQQLERLQRAQLLRRRVAVMNTRPTRSVARVVAIQAGQQTLNANSSTRHHFGVGVGVGGQTGGVMPPSQMQGPLPVQMPNPGGTHLIPLDQRTASTYQPNVVDFVMQQNPYLGRQQTPQQLMQQQQQHQAQPGMGMSAQMPRQPVIGPIGQVGQQAVTPERNLRLRLFRSSRVMEILWLQAFKMNPSLRATLIDYRPQNRLELHNKSESCGNTIEQTSKKCSADEMPKVSPSKWTVDEVCDFIRGLPGCSDYAEDFAIQEMDGEAIMQLQFDHLVYYMNMKLGPALKIFARIDSMRIESMSNSNPTSNN